MSRKYFPNVKKPAIKRRKKNPSRKDYLIEEQNSCCKYCKLKFKKSDLNLIKKNHTLQEGELFESRNNWVIACKKCSSKKGIMNHVPFLKQLDEERKNIREEIVSNYSEIATKVFDKYQYKCIYCDFEYGFTPADAKLTVEHKKPVFSLGNNNEKNLASGCVTHNKEKGSMTAKQYFEFLEKHGRKKKKIKFA